METEDLIIKHLSEGKTQYEISDILKKDCIKPNSLRYIELQIKAIKVKHKAKTMFHLGFILAQKK